MTTPFGAKKCSKFRKWHCCDCKTEIEVVHRTATSRCWDCNMKRIKQYQKLHNATNTCYEYLE